jgi:hypothetical protein
MDRPILLFTYSVSETDDAHVFPRNLACAVDQGIWSKVVDNDEIPESLASDSFLFTVGLSNNEDFTAWVEPYADASGWTMGTTYYRTVARIRLRARSAFVLGSSCY